MAPGVLLLTAALVRAGAAASVDEYISDLGALWGCHEYEGAQDDAWCASAGFEQGFEYTFGGLTPGVSMCLPCMCCKRHAIRSGAPAIAMPVAEPIADDGVIVIPAAVTSVAATTTMIAPLSSTSAAAKYEKHEVEIAGLEGSMLLAGGGGATEGGRLTLKHNSGFTLFSKFDDDWEPENMMQLKALGKKLSFSVDLSRVGCACNVALYLIAAPGRDLNGKPFRGPPNSGQPPYYCDGNMVGGQWCPEVDIMEANNHAFAATPHKCDAPEHGHYSSCDRDGCSQNTRDTPDAYGPGEEYTIDTTRPFHVQTEFPEIDGTLVGMVTTLQQDGRHVVLDHSACNRTDLATLSDVMANGMSLRITYWGDSAETMAWMDAPPCGRQACNASAGDAVISHIKIDEGRRVEKRPFAIEGLGPALLAGGGGSIEGGSLTLSHNSGYTLFSEFEGKWEPNNLMQLELLGKELSFTVDLSDVGCACNVALYLTAAPGRGENGRPYAGLENSTQPPFYCDANKVGGQWCPEVDIMEANNRALAATPHRCDEPTNGHYSNCDRQGCMQNTRDEPDSYGPGGDYTIDTSRPFRVSTEFPEEDGVLIGMVTTLRQAGRKVVLNHSSCEAGDLAALSGAMANGMSLQITYWGDSSETMAWMDAPSCGRQACNASTAGGAVIKDLSIQDFMWVVTDPQDELFGHEIPKEVVANKWLFTHRGDLGVAKWRGAVRSVRRQSKLPGEMGPEDGSEGSQSEASMAFVKKFLALPNDGRGGASDATTGQSFASTSALAAALAPLLGACLLGVASTLVASRFSAWHRRGKEQPPLVAPAMGASVASSPAPSSQISRGAGGISMIGGFTEGPSRSSLDLGARMSPMLRKGSSCQQLLTLAEADA